MAPVFCSFFTPAYAAEASGLVETLDAFGLPYDVRAVPDAGSWVLNCGMKPAFLLAMRAAHPGRPLVWLDADARVRKSPDLFNTLDCDIAFHRRRGELLSGTLYVGPGEAAGRLLEAWGAGCRAAPDSWDQRVLDAVLPTVPGLRVGRLPGSYVRIFDGADLGPVITIEHMQASRRLAKIRG